MVERTMREELQATADLLADIGSALSGGGRLTRQSVHLGTGKRYVTLIRDAERDARKMLARG